MIIERRSLLATALAALPSRLLAQQTVSSAARPPVAPVRAGADRLMEPHTIGASSAAFKVITAESQGSVFIMENALTRKGTRSSATRRANC